MVKLSFKSSSLLFNDPIKLKVPLLFYIPLEVVGYVNRYTVADCAYRVLYRTRTVTRA